MNESDKSLAKSVCDALVRGEASWGHHSAAGADSGAVVYYLSALKAIGDTEFPNDDVKYSVIQFLEETVDESSAKLLSEAMTRVNSLIEVHSARPIDQSIPDTPAELLDSQN